MNIWKVWAKTLGYKISDNKVEADSAAIIRTFWVALHVVTCVAIISNTIHHW